MLGTMMITYPFDIIIEAMQMKRCRGTPPGFDNKERERKISTALRTFAWHHRTQLRHTHSQPGGSIIAHMENIRHEVMLPRFQKP